MKISAGLGTARANRRPVSMVIRCKRRHWFDRVCPYREEPLSWFGEGLGAGIKASMFRLLANLLGRFSHGLRGTDDSRLGADVCVTCL
jgi:hypothetical protein